MADEKERVQYEFQGDVSSLKKATQDALGMLDKFQSGMNKMNSNGIVKASQRAQSGFQNSMNKMSKSVEGVQKKLSKVGDVKIPRGTAAFNATKAASEALSSALNKLNSSNTITSKGLNEIKTSLNNASAGLKKAGSSFDTIIAKEQKFQQQLTNIGAKAKSFADKFYGATDGVKNAFSSMGSAIGSKLSSIGKFFDPITSRIQGLKDRAAIAGSRISQVFSTVAAAFRRTQESTDGAAASQDKLKKSADGVEEEIKDQDTAIKKVSKSYPDMSSAGSAAFAAISAGASAALSAVGAIKNTIGGVVDSFFALAGVDVGNLFADGAKGAIDYVENLNLFQVAMGSSVGKGEAFVQQMQEVYGMDPSNIYRYAGYFYQLTDAIGMSEEASSVMSLSMTKAANDLASLFNSDVETVVNDLSSGMMGMSRTVRKYGMDIRMVTLEQTAMKYGVEGNVETMSEANRQALRYITMLEQAQNALNQTTTDTDGASDSMGDFARNIETPANQLRIFKEQMSQLGRAIGNFIVAPLSRALPYINGFIMALRTMVNFIATLMGVSTKAGNSLSEAGESADDAASGVGAIGNAADKASKKIKQLIAPFDELNVLQESSGEGDSDTLVSADALDPKLSAALAGMSLDLENISMKANGVRDSILGFMGLTVTTDPITGEQIIQWDKEAFMSNVMGSLNSLTDWLVALPGKIATAMGGLDGLKNWFSSIPTPLLTLTGGLGSLVALLQLGSGNATGMSGAMGLLTTALTMITSPLGLVTTSIIILSATSESFRTAFTNLALSVGTTFLELCTILSGVFLTIGTDIVNMWDTHILPTITAIGDTLAPVLETLGSLWENVSVIITDAFELVEDLWTTVLKPALEGAMEIIQDLCDIFKRLWEEYVGPVVEYIGDGVERLWSNTLKPVIDRIIGIVGKLIELIMALWNTVLKPVIDWLVTVLGPIIEGVFTAVWDIIETICEDIGDIIDALLQTFEGIIDFLTGVFTGDWERAWKGLGNIFVGIGNSIISVFETVVNGIISLINGLVETVWSLIEGFINGLLDVVEGIADFIGVDLDLDLDYDIPDIPTLSIPRIPELATGGVVSSPTHALIGEGKYSEAVLPLEDSPQMQDLIDKIANAVNKDDGGSPGPQPIEVKVYIGDKEYDAYTYKAAERGKKIVGKQPIRTGG